jgi:hypothetical protein
LGDVQRQTDLGDVVEAAGSSRVHNDEKLCDRPRSGQAIAICDEDGAISWEIAPETVDGARAVLLNRVACRIENCATVA